MAADRGAFVPRLTRPEAGNPYYNTVARGGYSHAVKGNPADAGCDVLSNCVGYAYGRFNEVAGLGRCAYLQPVNAERFWETRGNLQTGQEPRLGACMVWQGGASMSGADGAGHVAIVEQIVSSAEVVTSESGWKSAPFWTSRRKRGDGNWGMGGKYKFLGFIYNPAVPQASKQTAKATTEDQTAHTVATTARKVLPKVGEVVDFTGKTHYVNAYAATGPTCRPGKAVVTALCPAGENPVHLKAVPGGGSSVNGWVKLGEIAANDSKTTGSFGNAGRPNSSKSIAVGDIVEFTGSRHYGAAFATNGSPCSPGLARVTMICQPGKAPQPYHLVAIRDGKSTVYGWVAAGEIKKVDK